MVHKQLEVREVTLLEPVLIRLTLVPEVPEVRLPVLQGLLEVQDIGEELEVELQHLLEVLYLVLAEEALKAEAVEELEVLLVLRIHLELEEMVDTV